MLGRISLEHRNNLISMIWMLMWALAFSVAMSITKLLSSNTNTFVIVWIRLVFGFTFFLPFMVKKKTSELKTSRFSLYIIRAIFTSCSMLCTYYAYAHLPLAFASSIGFTSPLFTTLLAIFILKEQVKWQVWFILLIGYIGVLIMVHPGNAEFNSAAIVALLANLLASCSVITVKKLSSTESTTQIMFYSNVLNVLLLGAVAFLFWSTPNSQDMLLLILLGVIGLFSQFCNVQALKVGKPSILAPIEYSRLVFAIPLGILLFNEIPSLYSLVGSTVIILSTGYLAFSEFKQNNPRALQSSSEEEEVESDTHESPQYALRAFK